MIKYKKGNIFDSSAKVIAHGVNCDGGFGSGVAKEIATRFPFVRTMYMYKYEFESWKLGDIQTVPVESLTIVNCATQEAYGKPTEGPYVSYPAIRKCIKKLLVEFPDEVISLPKIGAGLAGGNWEIIEQIINEEAGEREIHVYVL